MLQAGIEFFFKKEERRSRYTGLHQGLAIARETAGFHVMPTAYCFTLRKVPTCFLIESICAVVHVPGGAASARNTFS